MNTKAVSAVLSVALFLLAIFVNVRCAFALDKHVTISNSVVVNSAYRTNYSANALTMDNCYRSYIGVGNMNWTLNVTALAWGWNATSTNSRKFVGLFEYSPNATSVLHSNQSGVLLDFRTHTSGCRVLYVNSTTYYQLPISGWNWDNVTSWIVYCEGSVLTVSHDNGSSNSTAYDFSLGWGGNSHLYANYVMYAWGATSEADVCCTSEGNLTLCFTDYDIGESIGLVFAGAIGVVVTIAIVGLVLKRIKTVTL